MEEFGDYTEDDAFDTAPADPDALERLRDWYAERDAARTGEVAAESIERQLVARQRREGSL